MRSQHILQLPTNSGTKIIPTHHTHKFNRGQNSKPPTGATGPHWCQQSRTLSSSTRCWTVFTTGDASPRPKHSKLIRARKLRPVQNRIDQFGHKSTPHPKPHKLIQARKSYPSITPQINSCEKNKHHSNNPHKSTNSLETKSAPKPTPHKLIRAQQNHSNTPRINSDTKDPVKDSKY